jgi:hypothetical protein
MLDMTLVRVFVTFVSVLLHTRVSKKEYLHHGQKGFVRVNYGHMGSKLPLKQKSASPRTPEHSKYNYLDAATAPILWSFEIFISIPLIRSDPRQVYFSTNYGDKPRQ